MKNESGRVLVEKNIGKQMKEIWGAKKAIILDALRKGKLSAVQEILGTLEDCGPVQEQGRFQVQK